MKKEHQGRGIGKRLLKTLIRKGEKAGLHTVVARIASGNEVSLHLFKSEEFELVGVMREVGRKFGKLVDVYVMQKIYC